MLWLLGRSPINKKIIATIAVEFAETCVHNAKDYPAVAECITTVKKYLSGQATQEELAIFPTFIFVTNSIRKIC